MQEIVLVNFTILFGSGCQMKHSSLFLNCFQAMTLQLNVFLNPYRESMLKASPFWSNPFFLIFVRICVYPFYLKCIFMLHTKILGKSTLVNWNVYRDVKNSTYFKWRNLIMMNLSLQNKCQPLKQRNQLSKQPLDPLTSTPK